MATSTRREFLSMAAVAAMASSLGKLDPDLLNAAKRGGNHSQSSVPNIVMVTIDALRADHVSFYGYHRNTTPNLDTFIAAQGVSFLRAFTTSPWTYAANAAMLTGQSPTQLAASWDIAGLPTGIPTLAEILQKAGYQTAGFVSAVLLRETYGFQRGFDHYDDSLTYGHPNSAQSVAQKINDLVFTWLDANRDSEKPLFLYIYYFDPHSWYNPPTPYDTIYDDSYTGTLTPEIFQDGQPIVNGEIAPSPRDIEHTLALYDGEIAYTDAKFGELMMSLQSREILDNALITVTSDHGESFGEHSKWAHASSLYEEAMQVPLFMRYSGVIDSDTIVHVPVSNMDLMPTILDYADIAVPPELSATSLRPLVEQKQTAQRDIFCELDGMNDPSHWIYWNASHFDLRAVYRDEWKYIHHVGYPDADELYRLNTTRVNETENLIAIEPVIAQQLQTTIMDNFGLWKNVLPFIAS